MGGKIRFGKISALGILAFQSLMGLAGTTLPEISIRSDYHLEDEPLTTDLIGKLDPAQINPQRMNWLLTRMTQISGLEVTKKDDGRYGVRVQGLLVTTRGYLRPDGIRFKRIEEFRCGADTHFGADPVFSTFEGNKNTLLFANDEWLRLLDEKRTLLAVTLAHLGHATEAGARDLGQRVFNRWLAGVEQDWRFKSIPMARAKEWKEYTQEASQKKICPRSVKKKLSEDVSKIESLSELEPLVGEPPKVTQILARVPARLWNGYFSVRMDIVLGDRALNGRFLIDPGAPQSVISPVWLENQGVYTAWVSAPDLKPSRVRWAIPPKDQTGALANWAHFDFVRMSGLKLPIQDFLLFNSDFYAPPEFVGSCCDGVLGLDFLRAFPIEFHAESPAEIRIWPRVGFHWGTQQTAKDLYETSEGLSETIPLLGKGTYTLDLPHGRIWYSKNYEPYRASNRSGLGVGFKSSRGDRYLEVRQIQPKSPAAKLLKDGLRVGTVITQIDSKDSADLDTWQVIRYLSGDYGSEISLQWETKDGTIKMAPLKVR